MKKLMMFLISALFILTGCNEESSILEPVNNYDDPASLEKVRNVFNIGLEDDSRELDDYSDEDSYRVQYSKNFTVNGSVGGTVGVKHEWINSDGERVRLVSHLKIPAGAFEGDLTFDMIFDVENNSMELYPSPFSFNIPVEFSMYWYGVDLTGYENDDLDFEYMDGEGEEIICKRKFVDVVSGTLIVQQAQLHHFSRYAWTRTRK